MKEKSSITNRGPSYADLVVYFSPYNEFRALYLAYKENNSCKKDEQLRKLKDRV